MKTMIKTKSHLFFPTEELKANVDALNGYDITFQSKYNDEVHICKVMKDCQIIGYNIYVEGVQLSVEEDWEFTFDILKKLFL